jgi:alpha-beta hydrolase superfamily lysophospholipase
VSQRLGDRHRVQEVTIRVEGATLAASLIRPRSNPEGGSRGGVFLLHGFAAERTENGLFLELADALAGGGFTVLTYDGRGLGGSRQGVEFHETGLHEHVGDVVAVARWFARTINTSVEALSAVAFSLGAALLLTARKEGLRLRASALLSPALRIHEDMWLRYRDMFSGPAAPTCVPKPDTGVLIGKRFVDALARLDLTEDVCAVGWPMLLCHGTLDTRIPFATTKAVAHNCAKWSTPGRFVPFEGASHSFRPDETHRARLGELLTGWALEQCSRAGKR